MIRKGIFAAVLFAVAIVSSAAFAQTAPGWGYGYVPTPAEWNAEFASKQDYLGARPLLITGGQMTGRLTTVSSTTGFSGLNVSPGVAPTLPNDGDVWVTISGIFVRINGVTIGPLSGATTSSFAGTSPIDVTFPAGVVTYAFNFTVANTFLAQQTNQGATTTSPGWYAQIAGDTTPRVRVGMNATDVPSLAFGPGNAVRDAFIERAGAASLRFGAPDAASPVAQTIGVQNVVAGTSNTAGVSMTIAGSQGTGTGAGGSILLKTAPAGSTGTAQNALATAVTVFSTGGVNVGAPTGGDKGAGSLNAQTIYVNNAAVLTGNQTITLSGDVGGSGTTTISTTIQPAAVTYAKIQNVAASRLLGNPTGSPASASEISLGSTLAFSGTELQTGAGTGDVTFSANSFATTLANIPTGVPAAGSILFSNIAAPASPASGKVSIYADSTDLRLHDKNASGVIGTTVVAANCSAGGQFVQTISTAGAITCNTPAGGGNVSNSGTPTSSQIAQWTSSTVIQGVNIVSVLSAGTGIAITGTTTATISTSLSTLTSNLGADVLLNNTGSTFDIVSVAQGTSGTWLAIAQVAATDTAASVNIKCELWDGTTVIAGGLALIPSAGGFNMIPLSGTITSPAANIKVTCKDTGTTTGVIKANASGFGNFDSKLTVFRLS